MATCSTSDMAWSEWSTSNYYTIDSGTCSGSVWANWVTSYRTTTYTATHSTSSAWVRWVGDAPAVKYQDESTTYYYWGNWVEAIEAQRETREQARARQAQTEINRIESERKVKEHEDAQKQAELTAQKLLEDLISEEEMRIYLKTGRVLVRGKRNDYILVKGFQADVIKIDKGKVIDLKSHKGKIKGKSYCVHPENQWKLPDTDKIIAMKVALESEESRIMKIANDRGKRELDLAIGM